MSLSLAEINCFISAVLKSLFISTSDDGNLRLLILVFMRKVKRKRSIKPINKNVAQESKKAKNLTDSDDNLLNLIADIVFENLLNKYKK